MSAAQQTSPKAVAMRNIAMFGTIRPNTNARLRYYSAADIFVGVSRTLGSTLAVGSETSAHNSLRKRHPEEQTPSVSSFTKPQYVRLMATRGKEILLGLSLLGNIVLAGALVIVLFVGVGVPGVLPSEKETEQLDRLVLSLRCSDGDNDACEKARKHDQESCAKGDGQGCVLLGISYQVGKKVPKDEAAAVPLFLKACSLDDGNGCWYAGTCYLRGRGVAKDMDRAIELLTKACDKNEKNGCLDLGDAYRKKTPADTVRALQAYDKGCKLGYDWACNRARDLRKN